MKRIVGILLGSLILMALATAAEAPAARHGIAADLKSYPQASPKETLAAVLKAIDLKRIDYLVAQLSDPDWVDGRIATLEGGYKELVQDATARLDPPRVKLLKRFLEQGEIETLDATAEVRLKDVKDRVVRLRKVNNRWYLRHLNKP